MGDYKEELSALVEKIRQDGAKEERRRIAEKLIKESKFCLKENENISCSNYVSCLDCVEEWLIGVLH